MKQGLIYIVLSADNRPFKAFANKEDAEALVTNPDGVKIAEVWPTRYYY